MITVIIITHGQFGQELLRTAEDIVGRQEAAVSLSVTSEMGVESLSKSLQEVLERLPSSEGVLYLVDMLGGTPCNTVLLKTKESVAEVVTGVNLYMVISSFTHRGHMDLKALAAKVMEDGKRAITLPRDLLMKRLA
jgi:PTS system mannose-specific IIA component